MNDNDHASDNRITRREFLGTVGTAAASVALSPLLTGALGATSAFAADATPLKMTPSTKVVLIPFDYSGVTLRPSPWEKQAASGRDFYMGLPTDDVLKGFRRAAGLPAPGEVLGGWCNSDSYTVFGQWMQAMARMQRAYGDKDMLQRAGDWVSEWAKAWNAIVARGTSGGGAPARGRGGRGRGPAGPPGLIGHYAYEKLLGGLVDMHFYGGHPDALDMAAKITDVATKGLNRDRLPAHRDPWEMHSGRPGEWYTLGENLYRAYQLTGNTMYKDFGDVWQYHAYWDKFAKTSDPEDANGVHAYSHCNTFSSCAMAYDVSGDEQYLTILKNFHDWMQKHQTYATGGYGPDERMVFSNGALGDSMEVIGASFECPCGSWAGLKVCKYLLLYTGEAKYGDWAERLLYNAIGAALWIRDRGVHMYYMDYHLGADLKYVSRSTFTCCSGTYFQNIAEYSNLVYFHDAKGVYVNLYLPSDLEWNAPGGKVKLTQLTDYPEGETGTIKLSMDKPMQFALKLRVPQWSNGMSLKVNGKAASDVAIKPGQWATIDREWTGGDTVEVTIPLRFRRVPIDTQHPERIALVRGPLVYAQEDPHKWLSTIPKDEDELNKLMEPLDNDPAIFQIANEAVASQRDAFKPYYRFEELERYRMYHDPLQRKELW